MTSVRTAVDPTPGVVPPNPSPEPDRPSGSLRRRHNLGFWSVAAGYLAAMIFNSAPTPLYPLYQARDAFSTAMVTVVFAVFALGIVVSLVLVGHVSDWLGRKRILLPAMGLEIVSAVLLLADPGLDGLLIGRFIGGLGVGMITGTATAHLHELHRAHRPHAGPERFEIVSTAANVGGLALGPLLAGLLAEYFDAPLRTPFVVSIVLLVVTTIAIALAPETVVTPAVSPAYRPQRITTNHGDRPTYVAAVASGLAAFAINGVYTSLSAGFVAGTLHDRNVAVAGTVAFALMAAATVAQTVTSRWSLPTRQWTGIALGAVGMVLLALGVQTTSLTLFVLAGVVAGSASGMMFKAAIGVVAGLAAGGKRGEALSGLFLFAYLGMSVPAIGIGMLVQHTSLATGMYWFSAVLLVVLAGTAVVLRRAGRR